MQRLPSSKLPSECYEQDDDDDENDDDDNDDDDDDDNDEDDDNDKKWWKWNKDDNYYCNNRDDHHHCQRHRHHHHKKIVAWSEQFSSVAATALKFDWMDISFLGWLELTHFLNRIKNSMYNIVKNHLDMLFIKSLIA